jgi:hypothetical protein
VNGGGRGIRTPVPVAREAIFKTAALNHSAIPPRVYIFYLLQQQQASQHFLLIFQTVLITRILGEIKQLLKGGLDKSSPYKQTKPLQIKTV